MSTLLFTSKHHLVKLFQEYQIQNKYLKKSVIVAVIEMRRAVGMATVPSCQLSSYCRQSQTVQFKDAETNQKFNYHYPLYLFMLPFSVKQFLYIIILSVTVHSK